MCRRNFFIMLFYFLAIFSNCSFANAQSGRCNDNLELLRQDLISMLKKIPAMPPIAQIYSPVRDLYDQAKDAANRGDYQSCVSKTDLALKHSKPYGNRY
jgi:hypothetical protein